MKDVLDKYLYLIQDDNEYCSKYMKHHIFYDKEKGIIPMLVLLDHTLIWKTIYTKQVLEAVVNSDYSSQLLKIEDFYYDELFDLFTQYNIIDPEISEEKVEKIYSRDGLEKRLRDIKTPRKLKDCIKIYINCEDICKELGKLVKSR